MISLLGIEILCTWFVGGERSNTVNETLLYEVVTQIHVVVLTYSQCYVDRAYPVALSYHFQHHQVALVECGLSCERDNHLVWYCIRSHHHATLLYSLLVDSHVEGICWNNVQVWILASYPIFQHILQFERFVAKLFLGCFWILLIEFENLLLCSWFYSYVLIGSRTEIKSWPCDWH